MTVIRDYGRDVRFESLTMVIEKKPTSFWAFRIFRISDPPEIEPAGPIQSLEKWRLTGFLRQNSIFTA